MKGSRSHHLAKHCLSSDIDVKHHFGSNDPKEIAREVAKWGQKQLQAKFNTLFAARTFSNNNQWLRRKLLEAAGVQTPKSAGRGRSSLASRPASPAIVQSTSSGPSSDTAGCSTPASGATKTSRPDAISGQEELRRTKRQRRPRTFEDMLILDLPQSCSDINSEADASAADPDFDLNSSQSIHPRTSHSFRSPERAASTYLSPNRSLSRSSESSAKSDLAFAKLFEANDSMQASQKYVRPYGRKDYLQPASPFTSEQLIRSHSVSSRATMHHSTAKNGYAGYTNDPVQHLLDMHEAQLSHNAGPYDLGSNCVRIPTPHGQTMPSRLYNVRLVQKNGLNHAAGPTAMPTQMIHSPQLKNQMCAQPLQRPMISRASILPSTEGPLFCPHEEDAFATSCLNPQFAESFSADMQQPAAGRQIPYMAPGPAMPFKHPKAVYDRAVDPHKPLGSPRLSLSQQKAAAAFFTGSHLRPASLACTSLISKASFNEPQVPAPPLLEPLSAPSAAASAAASSTPMDFIMQGFGSLPSDALVSSTPEGLVSESMLILDSMLPSPAA